MDIFTLLSQVMQLKKDVLDEENIEILETDLTLVDNLLLDVIPVFQIQGKETIKIWLQLLHNCFTQAKSILHRYSPSQRQRCVECLMCKPGRLLKEIKEWKQLFDYLCEGLQRDLAVFVRGREAAVAPVIAPVIPLMKDVFEEEENLGILQTELRPLDDLLLDISAVYQDQHKAAPETLKIWLQLLQNSLTEANSILHCYDPNSRRVNEWKVIFNYLFRGLQKDFSIFVSANQIVNRDPIPAMTAEESVQLLSKDEAWMLFRGIAFKENPVPLDIEECAQNIVDECKSFRLAISLVAAAMMGKRRVNEWETSLSSIKNADSSCPDTLAPELYRILRWSYDALPNSDVKNCFLYCAMYPKDEDINVQQLTQMWVAEGLVRSKQKSHLTDLAIGRSYLKLLVDRCFFQNATSDEDIIGWATSDIPCIRVHHAVREMAIHIGEEENCLFQAGERLQNFLTIPNEDCKRISVRNSHIENLPTQLSCPKLVSLMLSFHPSSEFLVRLTSLKVLQWSGGINSIPSSVGQLKQLEFLSLRGLKSIRDLPREIGHLSSLQFLDLQDCSGLQSLPSEICELKNLKYLSLHGCVNLEMIPSEISQLTSLSTLDARGVFLSVEAESEAKSIRSLKGLKNLTMLRTGVMGKTSSGIEEGIMGTWLDMRHLHVGFYEVMADLPHDMKNMSKLQLIDMWGYSRSSLPNYIYRFPHLECILLAQCHQLRELSPLELLPNLKALYLYDCRGLKELGIWNASGFCTLDKLVLEGLENLESIGRTLFALEGSENLESIGGTSNDVVWNESTLPRLRVLAVYRCPKLKRLPRGIDKSPNLSTIFGEEDWWQQIVWEDDAIRVHLHKLFKRWWGSPLFQ